MNKQATTRILYKKLLHLYPRRFREHLGESIEQTFNDLYKERQTKPGWFSFVLWMFVETAVGIVREHLLLITEGASMKNTLSYPRSAALISAMLLAVAFIVAPGIYLVGNLRDPMGPFNYAVADFLYGPVWAASMVSIVFMLRERIGQRAPRRMSLALLATILAAGTMVLVACIRSANRHYHLDHPELHLENSQTVLIVWTTLVAGLTGAGWHFLGWALVLIGSAGWTSSRLPRPLSALYLVAGASSLFEYLLPERDPIEGITTMLVVVVSIWQGILLWKGEPEETHAPEINTS
jgi:predicted membrane protein